MTQCRRAAVVRRCLTESSARGRFPYLAAPNDGYRVEWQELRLYDSPSACLIGYRALPRACRVPPDRSNGYLVDPSRRDDLGVASRHNRPAGLKVSLVWVVAMRDPANLNLPVVSLRERREGLGLVGAASRHAQIISSDRWSPILPSALIDGFCIGCGHGSQARSQPRTASNRLRSRSYATCPSPSAASTRMSV
jgi:hypothetical protein